MAQQIVQDDQFVYLDPYTLLRKLLDQYANGWHDHGAPQRQLHIFSKHLVNRRLLAFCKHRQVDPGHAQITPVDEPELFKDIRQHVVSGDRRVMQYILRHNAADQLAGAADDQFIRILLYHHRAGYAIIPVGKGVHDPFADRDLRIID